MSWPLHGHGIGFFLTFLVLLLVLVFTMVLVLVKLMVEYYSLIWSRVIELVCLGIYICLCFIILLGYGLLLVSLLNLV